MDCARMRQNTISSDTQGDISDQDTQDINEDETILDPNHTEERFRVDRRKLEQLIQGTLRNTHTSLCGGTCTLC